MNAHPQRAPQPELVFVALVAANRVIGDGQSQPWHFREDLQRFKALTSGHPLLMGRATFEAIGRLLPGRESVVLTRSPSWSAPGAHLAHDIDEAVTLAAGLPGGEQIMVVGGGQIYQALLPRATRLELTECDAPAQGEVLFPEVDPAQWVEIARDDRCAFAFVTYRRR
ncbi:dihydrofolate reductase [Gephyromycinifex aptenodytis]|uniref:dihydrofolate reductase n=1 Tax=Gephyromycinifex aptenodytis TaxID=2716227 RepID=UPI0014450D7B|nr:dihydrofolate reductase [Gephyromycinifex aptenodytis]